MGIEARITRIQVRSNAWTSLLGSSVS